MNKSKTITIPEPIETTGWTNWIPSHDTTHDLAVFIGRFQCGHNAHIQTIIDSLKVAERVLVIFGSAFQPRTYKNPWKVDEREEMLSLALKERGVHMDRVIFRSNVDTRYTDGAWLIRTHNIVNNVLAGIEDPKIVVVGHKKNEDPSTFYLDMFPQWDRLDHQLMESLDATDIRAHYFQENANLNFLTGVVPPAIIKYLTEWRNSEGFETVMAERDFSVKYKKPYNGLPYDIIFSTADAVVVQNAHVLLIKRRALPGKGLWAFPGGFVNARSDKSVLDAAIRELREETGLKVPVPVLIGNIKEEKLFDAIDRSSRGRIITTAFHIELPNGTDLPKVKGMDDAEKAQWIPIADVKSDQCFEDHFEILEYFVGTIGE